MVTPAFTPYILSNRQFIKPSNLPYLRESDSVVAFQDHLKTQATPDPDHQVVVTFAIDAVFQALPVGVRYVESIEIKVGPFSIYKETVEPASAQCHRPDTVVRPAILKKHCCPGAGIDRMITSVLFDAVEYLQHDLLAIDINIGGASHGDVVAWARCHGVVSLDSRPAPDHG